MVSDPPGWPAPNARPSPVAGATGGRIYVILRITPGRERGTLDLCRHAGRPARAVALPYPPLKYHSVPLPRPRALLIMGTEPSGPLDKRTSGNRGGANHATVCRGVVRALCGGAGGA